MAVISIGHSSSHCLDCGRGADLGETGHYSAIGYSEPDGARGCGKEWTGFVLECHLFDDWNIERMREHLARVYGDHWLNIEHLSTGARP